MLSEYRHSFQGQEEFNSKLSSVTLGKSDTENFGTSEYLAVINLLSSMAVTSKVTHWDLLIDQLTTLYFDDDTLIIQISHSDDDLGGAL